MSALLPFIKIDSSSLLARYFTPYQIAWIEAEAPFHAAKKQVFALAEKSVRIGWTFADGFKNVQKRLRFKKRDYLFVTKDWPSALEYMNQVYQFADILGYTRAVLNHGEDVLKVPHLDAAGHRTSLTEEVKIGYIKFENGSRIIAFSSNPYAMAVYGGDVGLDEFAKHPNAELLWQTAQARVTWNADLAVWSSHDGEDTLFNQFVQQARLLSRPNSPSNGEASSSSFSSSSSPTAPPSTLPRSDAPRSDSPRPSGPWNLYFRVTMPDAVELGLLDVINRTTDANFTAAQFLADCRARAGSEEIFQQSYMCNPLGATTAHIVEWSVIERCRYDYQIERLHFEADDVTRRFGQFNPSTDESRQRQIYAHIVSSFPKLFKSSSSSSSSSSSRPKYRLGFDVAASGQGDLAVMYIDEFKDAALWLRALFTCRTEDWQFIATVLYAFLDDLKNLQAAGDESGLGRQICWQAAADYSSRFTKVNFTSKKQELGFTLMNQLSSAEKRFPRSEQDVASDYFALRKSHNGTRWVFSESTNTFNPASHCDIAWAGALATYAHTQKKFSAGAMIC
jgi:phage FluMu gp28-like protein